MSTLKSLDVMSVNKQTKWNSALDIPLGGSSCPLLPGWIEI